MKAEAATAVMVLAVNVRRDHASNGDELGSGDDRREKAAMYENGQNIREEHAGFDRQQTRFRIKGAHAVETERQERCLFADRSVAVGAAIAARDAARAWRHEASNRSRL